MPFSEIARDSTVVASRCAHEVAGAGCVKPAARRNTAKQRGHCRSGLREAEDVVDEEQHVLALVAEIFGDGETGQTDAGAGARRLVHSGVPNPAFRISPRT